MAQVEELSDEVAQRLKVEQPPNGSSDMVQGEPESQNVPAVGAMFPELSPGRAMTEKKTVDEVAAELKRTPFFMTELEENDETEALKALAYEGTPLENASDFKERGNECFKERRWGDAKEFYTKGALILAAEERKRKHERRKDLLTKGHGKLPLPPAMRDEEEAKKKKARDETQEERSVLETLYVNRAACHLELKNFRSCWLDGAAALRLNDQNVKAYYRSARAFLAVDRIAEADDACARGLGIDAENTPLKAVARDIIKRNEEITAKQRRENERSAREKRRKMLVRAALKARNIRTRTTAQPPEMEDARIRLVPDDDDPRSTLALPAVLLYPLHLQSDFIKAFNETETLSDHLAYVFPLPWDGERAYDLAGVECYLETVSGGLVKVGKKAPLLKVLSSDNVEVVDEVVKIFVLPKNKAAEWVVDFKRKKTAERGPG